MEKRIPEGVWKYLFYSIACAFSLFYLYTAMFGIISTESHRIGYIMCTFTLILLLYPARSGSPFNRPSFIDLFLVASVIMAGMYYIVNYLDIQNSVGDPTNIQLIMGGILILLSLEIARRTLGNAIPLIAICFLFYAYFGYVFPGVLYYRGVSLDYLIEYLYSMEGLFGVVNSGIATYVFLFVLFGSVLEKTGIGTYMIQFGYALTCRFRSGPAQTAIVSSALLGMITGSSIANTVTTGTFTIPLMKRCGYKPEIAAATEAATSTGSQFMPPVMGAGVFIMAELTGIPYLTIVIYSIVPALLFFASESLIVHLEAVRTGIQNVSAEDKKKLPTIKESLKSAYNFIPLVLMIVVLVLGYSAPWAAVLGILSAIIINIFDRKNFIGYYNILMALRNGAVSSLTIGAIIGCVGIVIGVINLSGIGLKFSELMLLFTYGNLDLVLLLAAVASAIIGMGMPVVASYVVVAVLAAPAMLKLGVDLIAAHLIVFWFSQLSNLTPPVCLSAYAAAAIAQSDMTKTALAACRYGVFIVVIPFLFITTKLLTWTNAFELAYSTFIAVCVCVAIVASLWGILIRPLTVIERLLYSLSAVLILLSTISHQNIGLILFGILVIFHIVMTIKGGKLNAA